MSLCSAFAVHECSLLTKLATRSCSIPRIPVALFLRFSTWKQKNIKISWFYLQSLVTTWINVYRDVYFAMWNNKTTAPKRPTAHTAKVGALPFHHGVRHFCRISLIISQWGPVLPGNSVSCFFLVWTNWTTCVKGADWSEYWGYIKHMYWTNEARVHVVLYKYKMLILKQPKSHYVFSCSVCKRKRLQDVEVATTHTCLTIY